MWCGTVRPCHAERIFHLTVRIITLMSSSVAALKMRIAISPRLAAMILRIGRHPALVGGGVASALADEKARPRTRPSINPPTHRRPLVQLGHALERHKGLMSSAEAKPESKGIAINGYRVAGKAA